MGYIMRNIMAGIMGGLMVALLGAACMYIMLWVGHAAHCCGGW